jgi:hypothetical protein
MSMVRSLTVAACVLLLTALSPTIRARTRVVDEKGLTVPGAKVTLILPASGAASAVYGPQRLTTVTDARGSFAFTLPRIAGGFLVIDHASYAPLVVTTVRNALADRTLTLASGTELRGRVSAESAISGPGTACAVWTVAATEDESGVVIRRCAAVSASGEWTLGGLPMSGAFDLEIEIPGFLPLRERISAGRSSWRGRLESGLKMLVRVEDARGRPAPGATVECRGAVSVTTNEKGEAWPTAPPSPTECRASTEAATSDPASFDPRSPRNRLLRLTPQSVVRGSVVAGDGERSPVAPRFFVLEEIPGGGRRASPANVVSYENSDFRIRLPDVSPVALRIEVPGWLPLTTPWFGVSPGEAVDVGPLRLRRGGGFTGRIHDVMTGKPVAGATVQFEPLAAARIVLGKLGRATAITDDDGEFIVSGLMPASYRARIEWGDFAPVEFVADLFEESLVTLGSFPLHPGVRLSGRAHLSDGSNLVNARIDLLPVRAGDDEPSLSLESRSDGTFGPAIVAPGHYRGLLYAPDLIFDREVEIAANSPAENLDFEVHTARLVGRVTERGRLVSGGELLFHRGTTSRPGITVASNARTGKQLWQGRPEISLQATIDANGFFSFDHVPPGRLLAEYFGRSGSVSRVIDVAAEPEVAVAIELDRWDITGNLRDTDTGEGVAGLVELRDSAGTLVLRASSDKSGQFHIRSVEPGDYRLIAAADGFTTPPPIPLRVGAEAPPEIRVQMARGREATLDIILRRNATTAAAGVMLVVVDSAGRQLRALPTLIDGTLHIAGLTTGVVHVVWSDPLAGTGISAPIELRPGLQSVTLTLDPGKDLVLRCEGDCEGRSTGPIQIIERRSGIDLAPILARSRAIAYSENAEAWIGRLSPGEYEIVANAGRLSVHETFEIAAGPGEARLSLR